jgi:hypothetical protein
MRAQFIEGLESRQFFSVGPFQGTVPPTANPDATRDAIHDRDRLKDGACTGKTTTATSSTLVTTMDKIQKRLRDASCKV